MSDDMLERVRRCVAEAGYDPAYVKPGRNRPGSIAITLSRSSGNGIVECVPHEVAWRARSLAGETDRCYACYRPEGEACVADRPLVLDCGVTRD